jgi:hypothetical protein
MHIKLVFCLALLIASFSTPASAHGYDSLIRKDLMVAADLSPVLFGKTPEGGYWVVAEGSGDNHQLVKLSSNGGREAGLFLPSAPDSNQLSIYPLADGGVLELNTNGSRDDDSRCGLRRVSSQGELVFARQVKLRYCYLKLSTPGNSPYLVYTEDDAELLATDGSTITRFRTDGFAFLEVGFAKDRRDLIFLNTNGSSPGYMLSRANALGQETWKIPVMGVESVFEGIAMQVLSDGNIMVVSIAETGVQQDFYSDTGGFLRTKVTPIPGSLKVRGFDKWAHDEQGNFALSTRFIDGSVLSNGALLFSPNGNLNKSIIFSSDEGCNGICTIVGLSRGFARHVRTDTQARLIIISPDAAAQDISREISSNNFSIPSNGHASTILTPGDALTAMRAFTLAGAEVAPPSMSLKGFSIPEFAAAASADNGTRYVLTYAYRNMVSRREITQIVTGYAPDGRVAWQNRAVVSGTGSAYMIADSRRVCIHIYPQNFGPVAQRQSITCFAGQTGVELASLTLSAQGSGLEGRPILFLADGRVRFASVVATGVKVVDVSASNAITEFSIALERVFYIADVGSNGAILLVRRTADLEPSEWVLLSPTGEITWQRNFTKNVFSIQSRGQLLANSDAIIMEPRTGSNATETPIQDTQYISSNGNLQWTTSLPRFAERDTVSSITPGANLLYFLRRTYNSNSDTSSFKVQAVSQIDGQLVWTKELKGVYFAETEIFKPANSSELFVSISSDLGVALNRINALTGDVLERRMLGCGSESCRLFDASVSQDGAFQSISIGEDPGRKLLVLATHQTRVAATEISLTQLGIGGAWYTPQLSGQGLFIEYFPANNVIFAPWFTFTDNDAEGSRASPNSSSVANLRWYTLTGVLSPGAREAKLEIRRNIAGVFDGLPTTASSVVGQATLRAQDCNLATLEYEFNPTEAKGKYGVLPLTRLTGGSASCQLNVGQSLPGRDARPARGGFDSRQSGAWYEPQTSGQGFMLTVQPATASATGVFFGGWFTYDVGAPNDETAQHWFTLSGDVRPDAPAGVIPVIIYRTLGGRLAEVQTRNTAELGRGTVTFNGCGNATFRYQFDDALIAGSFRGKTGEIPLQRLGACPAE